MEMMLTSRTVKADEGLRLELAQFVVPAGQALDKALELAASIKLNAPLSNYAIINGLPRIRDASHDDGLFFESMVAAMTVTTHDSQVGLTQFLEKRAERLAPENHDA